MENTRVCKNCKYYNKCLNAGPGFPDQICNFDFCYSSKFLKEYLKPLTIKLELFHSFNDLKILDDEKISKIIKLLTED